MSQDSQGHEPDLVACASQDLSGWGYGAHGPEGNALTHLPPTSLTIRSSPPVGLERYMEHCGAPTNDGTTRGLAGGACCSRASSQAAREELHRNYPMCGNNRARRFSRAQRCEVSTVSQIFRPYSVESHDDVYTRNAAASRRQLQINRNQSTTSSHAAGDEEIPAEQVEGSIYSLALHHLTEAQYLNLLHTLSEEDTLAHRLPPWYNPPPSISHHEHLCSCCECSSLVGVRALAASATRPDLVMNTPMTTALVQSDLTEVLQCCHGHWQREAHQLFSRNTPKYLVQHSPDSINVWVIMSGGRDGLESASLMRHGSRGGRSYTSEGGMLKEGEGGGQATPGGGGGGGGVGVGGGGRPGQTNLDGPADELDYVESDAPLLSQFHEDAIQQAGTGPFQRLLLLVVGLGLAADTIELFVVAYVIPSAEVELCMSGPEKGWLAAITFIGMMIGAMIWGSLSDNVGRRRALLSALFVNAIFGIMTAFMPTYGIFMTTRLCSGIGIGGGIPIVFAYYCEFVTQAERGRHLSWLLVFWAVGGVFTALMAWIIIPRTGITVVLDEEHHFSSWRVFLVVCSLPSFGAVIGLYFMPESPRFLLEKGREVEAIMVYKKIFKWNNAHNPGAEYQLSELELPSGTQRPLRHSPPQGVGKNFVTDISYGLEQFRGLFLQLFLPPYLKPTILLLIVWMTCSFGFYGLSVWFPEYIKLLTSEEYNQHANITIDEVYENFTFNNTLLDNFHYERSTFNSVTFSNTLINHVVFLNCSFFDCLFSDVRTSKTFFKNCYVVRSTFIDTDIYEYRFQQCQTEGNQFRALVPGCQLDFDYNIHYEEVFQENLIGQLTMIPGTLITSLLMDKLGRVRIMSVSMALSALAAFFIWFLRSKIGVIVFEAVFNFIFISGWNALDIASTETFPTHIRTTAYGFLSASSRIAGVLGSLCFGQFIYSSRAIPMLTTSAVLLLGSLVSLKLQETKDNLL